MWFPTVTNAPFRLLAPPSAASDWRDNGAPPRRGRPGSKQEQQFRRPVALATHPCRLPARQAEKAERLGRASRRQELSAAAPNRSCVRASPTHFLHNQSQQMWYFSIPVRTELVQKSSNSSELLQSWISRSFLTSQLAETP